MAAKNNAAFSKSGGKMKARKNQSKKWSNFPKELIEQISEIFQKEYSGKIDDKALFVEGRIYSTELMLRVGLNSQTSIKWDNFICSLDFNPAKENAVQRIHLCVDAVGSFMDHFFELKQKSAENSSEEEMPVTWSEMTVNKQKVFLMYSTENADLEKEADLILKEGKNTNKH
jgi:hypothetical protein